MIFCFYFVDDVNHYHSIRKLFDYRADTLKILKTMFFHKDEKTKFIDISADYRAVTLSLLFALLPPKFIRFQLESYIWKFLRSTPWIWIYMRQSSTINSFRLLNQAYYMYLRNKSKKWFVHIFFRVKLDFWSQGRIKILKDIGEFLNKTKEQI